MVGVPDEVPVVLSKSPESVQGGLVKPRRAMACALIQSSLDLTGHWGG